MTQHTKGPWELEGTHIFHKVGEEVDLCIDVYSTVHNEKYDARLIAAAPELLEALKAVMPAFDNDSISVLCRIYADDIRNAQAAIAKAEGRG
jgi:hypothetical protein